MTEMILGAFSPEQFERLQRALLPATDDEIAAVLGLLDPALTEATFAAKAAVLQRRGPSLRDILDRYRFAVRVRQQGGDLEIHRRRLRQIEATAEKLSRLVSTEPLIFEIELGDSGRGVWPNFRATYDRSSGFRSETTELLALLSENAGRLSRDLTWLKAARFERPENGKQKDLERVWLWEPIFQRWRSAGRKIPASREGAMWHFLCEVHEALNIAAPGVEAVQSAIRAFNNEGTQSTTP